MVLLHFLILLVILLFENSIIVNGNTSDERVLSNNLLSACQTNSVIKVKEVLDINDKLLNIRLGAGRQTPIMAATLYGSFDVVKFLLSMNADISIGEKDNYTPIHGAGFQGRSDIAALLIEHGVDPFDMHSDGYLAIHRACWGNAQRHSDTVKVFLESGVPFDIKSKKGETPLEITNNPITKNILLEWKGKNIEL